MQARRAHLAAIRPTRIWVRALPLAVPLTATGLSVIALASGGAPGGPPAGGPSCAA